MDKKILLQNLAESLAERTGLTKRKAEAFVRSFFELTEEAIETDGQVKVKSFGTTKIVNVNGRESVNINTGERFQIEGHAKVSFTPDALFRDLVNRPFAHFTTIVLEDGVEDDELADAATTEEPQEENNTQATPAEQAETASTAVSPTEQNAPDEAPVATEDNTQEETPVVNAEGAVAGVPEADYASTEEPEEEDTEDEMDDEIEDEASEEVDEEATNEAADDEEAESEVVINDDEEAEDAPISDVPANDDSDDDNIAPQALNTDCHQASNNAQQTGYAEGLKSPIIINNTIPEPQHNWWRTAFILLAMGIIALISYFCGYYRLFCPCNFWGTDAEQITQNEQQKIDELNQKIKADSIEKAAADSARKAKADSITNAAIEASKEADAKRAAAEKAEKEAAAEKAAAEKASREMAAKQAKEKKEAERKALMQEAQKYPQLPGKYLITGVLKTRTIRPGENLYLIAKQVYGSKGFARYISFHNGIEDPNIVTVGQRIQLPRLMKK